MCGTHGDVPGNSAAVEDGSVAFEARIQMREITGVEINREMRWYP